MIEQHLSDYQNAYKDADDFIKSTRLQKYVELPSQSLKPKMLLSIYEYNKYIQELCSCVLNEMEGAMVDTGYIKFNEAVEKYINRYTGRDTRAESLRKRLSTAHNILKLLEHLMYFIPQTRDMINVYFNSQILLGKFNHWYNNNHAYQCYLYYMTYGGFKSYSLYFASFFGINAILAMFSYTYHSIRNDVDFIAFNKDIQKFTGSTKDTFDFVDFIWIRNPVDLLPEEESQYLLHEDSNTTQIKSWP